MTVSLDGFVRDARRQHRLLITTGFEASSLNIRCNSGISLGQRSGAIDRDGVIPLAALPPRAPPRSRLEPHPQGQRRIRVDALHRHAVAIIAWPYAPSTGCPIRSSVGREPRGPGSDRSAAGHARDRFRRHHRKLPTKQTAMAVKKA
jgi:hypothetical protein